MAEKDKDDKDVPQAADAETETVTLMQVPDGGRVELLQALANMPDEAYGWFVLWASGNMTQYPDGLGGFRNDSRESILELRRAAKAAMERMG